MRRIYEQHWFELQASQAHPYVNFFSEIHEDLKNLCRRNSKPLKLQKVKKKSNMSWMHKIYVDRLVADCHKTYTPIIRSYTFSKLMHPGIHRWYMTQFAIRKNVNKHKGAVLNHNCMKRTAVASELLWQFSQPELMPGVVFHGSQHPHLGSSGNCVGKMGLTMVVHNSKLPSRARSKRSDWSSLHCWHKQKEVCLGSPPPKASQLAGNV